MTELHASPDASSDVVARATAWLDHAASGEAPPWALVGSAVWVIGDLLSEIDRLNRRER